MTSPGPVPAHDDGTVDALAMVECTGRDDMEGLAALIVNASLADVCVSLAKMLAEAACPCCLASGEFRRWGQEAVRRG